MVRAWTRVRRMSLLAVALSPLRRPMGLAGRAVLFTTTLLLLTAALAVAAMWYGAERESERHQSHVARDLTVRFADTISNMITDGNAEVLPDMLNRMANRDDVRRLALRDIQGRVIAEHGDFPEDAALADSLLRRVQLSGEVEYMRGADGALAVGAPMRLYGERAGAAAIIWTPNQFRFNTSVALTPFFLLLGGLLLTAIPFVVFMVRRAIQPLDELTRFAERVAENGEPAPLNLRTGDEFETLANAFNQMIGRLDASMRRIQEIAFVDPVTQLPNQDRFQREVDLHILQAKSPSDAGAVFVFEFRRLAKLMPTLDPEAARDLLRLVAERFVAATRTVDRVMALRPHAKRGAATARLGVTDFAVHAPGMGSVSDAARFGQHLNAALNQPFEWRGHKLSLGAVCGVALALQDGKDADAVLRHARIAVNAAEATPARLKVFTQSLDREAVARVTLEREMRGALERGEFRAFFQPKVNLTTGRIEAAEALARWVRPDNTIVSPNRFIPLAEESGLIGALSDAIMREACWKAAAWARAGAPVKMAVNVSALQFQNERFAERVLQIVNHAGLPPSFLELEITESVAMENPARALALIQTLRAAGIRFAIDDFGCGHSSLAALSNLPFDVIKIDQQFVAALERQDSQSIAIIEMILALAATLNLEVVAEGVERREHVEFMAARGCRWVQGFYYGAAVSPSEFVELLRRQANEARAAVRAA
jgi:EAL domain-containing protein (putative c-di-GMP-specific phosphodiesterase class I)/GGDEF domain-containing protein